MFKHYTIQKMIRLVWYYFWGHILGFLFYKRKYYYGQWFKGHFGGIAAPGWRWICIDALGRRFNPDVPWPCSPHIIVGNYKNIHFHPDDINNFQGVGNHYQTWSDGHIYIGYGSWIASNVSIITTNHSVEDPDEHVVAKNVVLGEHCWIGANSVILPGVELGPHTVVGAGSVVTKKFPEGYCVIAGNPARIIKNLPKEKTEKVFSESKPEQNDDHRPLE